MRAACRVVVLPAARADLRDAPSWYERQSPGLGGRFRAAVDEQMQRLEGDPMRFPQVLEDIRRLRLNRFPYALFYRVAGDSVAVMACFHARREPLVWPMRR